MFYSCVSCCVEGGSVFSMSLGMKRSGVYVCSLWEVVKSSLTLQLV